MDSLKGSLASLHELAAARGVTVARVSPLASPGTGDGGPAAPAALPDELEEALYIAAEPEALVRIQVVVPGAADVATVGMLVREGRTVRFTIDGGVAELTPPADLEDLAGSLAGEAAYTGPLAGHEAYFWPSALKLLSILWQDTQDPARPVSRAAAVRSLSAAGSAAEVEKAIGEMVRVGLVRAEGDSLHLDSTVQPWLALVWSGHVLQIEYLPLPAGTAFEEAARGTGDVLLFVGPPGQRIVSLRLTGDAMREHAQGGAPTEDAIVRLFAPPAEMLRGALGVVLKLQPAPVA